jgi:predicted AlkP superfamily phosphohydrolase/phosphomutase
VDRALRHLGGHYLDPTHPWRHDGQDRSAPVLRYFQKVDESIARILARTDDDTLVIILSDHGMGAAHNFVVLNNWLLQTRLLKPARPADARPKLLFDPATPRNVHRVTQLWLASWAPVQDGLLHRRP